MKQFIDSLFNQYNIKNISCDSRNLKPHDAFFAIKGEHFDGNEFIDEALKTAALVITDNPQNAKNNVVYVENIRFAFAVAAGIVYPSLPQNLLAVTGTNGKTSIVSYIHQILSLLGRQSATIGTIGLKSSKIIEKDFLDTLHIDSRATPGPIDFRKILNKLAELGIDNVAFEASSHGIHQRRLGDIKIKTAGFISFSQDHLDYHKTMEEYLQVKLQLFVDNLEKDGQVVVSSEIIDSKYGHLVKDFFRDHKIRYCIIGKNGDIQIDKIDSSLVGAKIYFTHNNKDYKFTTDIIGSFQATNLLMAARMVENLGVDFEQIVAVLPKLKAVAGRLERVGHIDDEFQIFVDYAHTPDSLEKSLLELQKIKHPDGKLYVIFGCGGDRDHTKRMPMGQVACKVADYVVVTDDNPRSEDPAKIRADVLKTAICAEEIADREVAIANIIAKLRKNDILLIAGKGHEDYQIIGDKILHFSDVEVATRYMKQT